MSLLGASVINPLLDQSVSIGTGPYLSSLAVVLDALCFGWWIEQRFWNICIIKHLITILHCTVLVLW